ncbi:exosortase P [Kutzneria kofuensis]|uniref:Exosortase/archaeosortase family protein n=1 Tax=Kutzneria kofuensis TaxID=103725 RepID=A0A7W9KEM4_9PSEU|nr:exosortase P [Kutzneria kofuensis]MBB5891197.1 exosortase/archaeosortase family protein [Kutzneria kofuensis]
MTAVTTTPHGRAPSRAVVVLLVAAAAGLVLAHRLYLGIETAPAGLVTQTVHLGQECTSAYLLVPLLLLTSVLVALRPQATRKALVALGFAALALIVSDQVRILTLVGLISWLGVDTGYFVGHTLLGSLISAAGGAAALVLFGWLIVRREKA